MEAEHVHTRKKVNTGRTKKIKNRERNIERDLNNKVSKKAKQNGN
ncbi:MAG: hypothetical protein QXK57_03930 [Conexivisphaerales archaeon]